jgi:hypothetical protein
MQRRLVEAPSTDSPTSSYPPAIFTPVRLGTSGGGLQNHLPFEVLALGQFLSEFAAFLGVPICVNYVVEAYNIWPLQASVTMDR